MDQAGHEGNTPPFELGVQKVVPRPDVLGRINVFALLGVRIHELGLKGSGADTSPGSTIHCVNRRKCIA